VDDAGRGFGMVWDPQWVEPDRLRIRGYRSVTGYDVVARWDLEALIATVDEALETAQWPELDRLVTRKAIRDLYEPDLKT